MAMTVEKQKAFAAAVGVPGGTFAANAEALGFDPISLIMIVLPIVMKMLEQCLVPPPAQVNVLKGKGLFARMVVDKATAKAMKQVRTTQGDSSNPDHDDVKTLSRPLLDTAASLPSKELLAMLKKT